MRRERCEDFEGNDGDKRVLMILLTTFFVEVNSLLHLPNKISLYQIVSMSSLDVCELLNSYYGERKPLIITSTG